MIITNRLKDLLEDYNPQAVNILKNNGFEDGSKVSALWQGRMRKGKIMIAGEDPANHPVIWFKGRGTLLIPLPEIDVIEKID